MHRNLSTALRRLSHASSPDHILSATHLCKSCQSLIITRDLIKNIPVSQLPNGRKALDLLHGFIDLPTKKKDESPEFPQLKMSASMGCEFCGALFEAIQWERETFKDDWRWKHSNAEVMIKFRYCCGPDLGLGSFEAGRWPTILSALEALVYRKDHVNDTNPLVIVFKASCDAGNNSPSDQFVSRLLNNSRFNCWRLFSHQETAYRRLCFVAEQLENGENLDTRVPE